MAQRDRPLNSIQLSSDAPMEINAQLSAYPSPSTHKLLCISLGEAGLGLSHCLLLKKKISLIPLCGYGNTCHPISFDTALILIQSL